MLFEFCCFGLGGLLGGFLGLVRFACLELFVFSWLWLDCVCCSGFVYWFGVV